MLAHSKPLVVAFKPTWQCHVRCAGVQQIDVGREGTSEGYVATDDMHVVWDSESQTLSDVLDWD